MTIVRIRHDAHLPQRPRRTPQLVPSLVNRTVVTPEATVRLIGDRLADVSQKLAGLGVHCHSYSSAEEFIASKAWERSGCVLVDDDLPDRRGLALLEWLNQCVPHVPRILVLATNDVPTAVRAMRFGAVDVFVHPLAIETTWMRIQEINEEQQARKSVAEQRLSYEERFQRLSRREKEIMIRLTSNQSTQRIASELGISPKTVGVHRAHIMAKMETDGVVELTKIAHRLGLVD
jgi:two-component system response regulator FixJ